MYYRGAAAAIVTYDITRDVSIRGYQTPSRPVTEFVGGITRRFSKTSSMAFTLCVDGHFLNPTKQREDRFLPKTFLTLVLGSFFLLELFCVCCVVLQDTFDTLKSWISELRKHGPVNIVMAVAGNKCDLTELRQVQYKGTEST